MIAPMTARALDVLQAAPDTLVVLPIRDAMTLVSEVALVLIAVLFSVFLVASFGLFLQFLRLSRTVDRLAREVRRHVAPTSAKFQVVADNLSYVTATIREDMDRVHESVTKLTGRLNQASDRVEDRIEEFNALLELVQSEAEHLFLDTASTVRAVRAGARSLSAPVDPDPDDRLEED